MPITVIPFPSVSICADGINYEVLDAAIIKLILDYRGSVNSSVYNMTLTPIQLSKLYNKKFRNEVDFSLSIHAYYKVRGN